MLIEICANSFKSARNAQLGGADRIELCEDLSVGGLTPSRDLIRKVIDKLDIEIQVLIRPRAGDFVYSEKEINQMISDIKFCNQLGCTGVVSGALTPSKEIDIKTTKRLIEASKKMQFTFHRAFDVCENPLNSISILKDLKVFRLLSSGQKATAKEGLPLLKELLDLSEEKIEIMPGSGINSENALMFKNAGFSSVHLSAIKKEPQSKSSDLFKSKVEGYSNLEEIKKVIDLLS